MLDLFPNLDNSGLTELDKFYIRWGRTRWFELYDEDLDDICTELVDGDEID